MIVLLPYMQMCEVCHTSKLMADNFKKPHRSLKI